MITPLIQSLVDLGVPLHPIKAGTKAPIADAWQKSSTVYKSADWLDGCNVGLRVGMPMGAGTDRYGRFRDRYSFILDIDKQTFDPTESKALERLITKFFKKTDSDASFYKIFERSGGEHRGKHIFGCSHLPFNFTKAVHKSLPVDLYGLTADYDARNVLVTPSVITAPYTVLDTRNNGTNRYSADADVVMNAWQCLMVSPISEALWLNIVKDLGYTDEHIFVNAFWPLIFSEDFNYDFFGLVLSAIAVTKNFDCKILAGWVNTLLKHLPNGDKNTIEKINIAILESPGRKRDDAWPGFPRLKRAIEKQLPISRGYENNTDNLLLVDRAVNWYANLIEELFTGKIKAETISSATINRLAELLLTDRVGIVEPGFTQEDFLRPGVSMMFGSEGSCKTWLGIDLCIAAINGADFWGGRYTFREPYPVLYVYGDKSRSALQQQYLTRYARSDGLKPNFKVFYVQNIIEDIKSTDIEPFIFDISKQSSQDLVRQMILNTGAKIVIIDTLATCMSIKTKDEDAVKMFVGSMKRLAIETGCHIILQHHANKMNAPDLRAADFTSDDYQGSKMFGAICDFTISVQGSKKNPYEGKVRIGKLGSMSGFEGFDYKINNRKWDDDTGYHHEVTLDFTEPVDKAMFGESIVSQKKQIISNLREPMLRKELREKMRIGTTSEMTSYRFKKNLEEMIVEQFITASGTSNNTRYVATAFGLELVNSVPDIYEGLPPNA